MITSVFKRRDSKDSKKLSLAEHIGILFLSMVFYAVTVVLTVILLCAAWNYAVAPICGFRLIDNFWQELIIFSSYLTLLCFHQQ